MSRSRNRPFDNPLEPESPEEERLAALDAYQILDTPEEPEFNALARLARQICNTQISQINFVARDRQWNKASLPEAPKEMPRNGAFCSTTIQQEKWLVVENAAEDDRFRHFPFVKDDPNIRFYAGVNLKSQNGYNIGTICVLGMEPKKLEDWQLDSLQILASEVETRLELRRNQLQLKEKNRELEKQTTFLENSTDLVLIIDPENRVVTDINPKVEQILGYRANEVAGLALEQLSVDESLLQRMDEWAPGSGEPFEGEFRMKNIAGKPVWLHIHMTEKSGHWYATARDITKRKEQEITLEESLEEKEVLLAEIHHRVKNNLAVISGMLELEAMHTDDERTRSVLQKSQLRIRSMGAIHKLLYEGSDFANVSFRPFLKELVRSITSILREENSAVTIYHKIDDIRLNVNQAIPAALLMNELLSNSCREALEYHSPDNPGRLQLQVSENGETIHIHLRNEAGPIAVHQRSNGGDISSFNLVRILAKQLQADLTPNRPDRPGAVDISFQKRDKKGTGNAFLLD
ncbi:MAG: histidine kinase dimerization/phosphoacceptor domain -containing protein [Balneolaceae bacterium]